MFITQDMVGIITFHVQSLARNSLAHFPSHPCLRSREAERAYLEQIADVLLHFLLPAGQAALPSLRDVLRRVVVNTAYDSLQYLCDPDYLNRYMVYRCAAVERHDASTDHSYRYAPTFDKFMETIRTCNDVEQLKEIRYHVIAEIVQAAHIEKCKQLVARGAIAILH